MEKSISKGFTGSKNPVRQAWFFKIDFSKINYRWVGHQSTVKLNKNKTQNEKVEDLELDFV